MSTTRLPELPKAAAYATQIKEGRVLFEPRASFNVRGHVSLFSADQMHAYGLAVWKAAMEAAAHELEQIANVISGPYESDGHYALLNACATTIRSLLPLPELAGSPQERREG